MRNQCGCNTENVEYFIDLLKEKYIPTNVCPAKTCDCDIFISCPPIAASIHADFLLWVLIAMSF